MHWLTPCNDSSELETTKSKVKRYKGQIDLGHCWGSGGADIATLPFIPVTHVR